MDGRWPLPGKSADIYIHFVYIVLERTKSEQPAGEIKEDLDVTLSASAFSKMASVHKRTGCKLLGEVVKTKDLNQKSYVIC